MDIYAVDSWPFLISTKWCTIKKFTKVVQAILFQFLKWLQITIPDHWIITGFTGWGIVRPSWPFKMDFSPQLLRVFRYILVYTPRIALQPYTALMHPDRHHVIGFNRGRNFTQNTASQVKTFNNLRQLLCARDSYLQRGNLTLLSLLFASLSIYKLLLVISLRKNKNKTRNSETKTRYQKETRNPGAEKRVENPLRRRSTTPSLSKYHRVDSVSRKRMKTK